MNKSVFLTIALVCVQIHTVAQQRNDAPRKDENFSLHGTSITDPYLWMENVEDPVLKKWTENETKEARKILNKCSNKFTSYNEIEKLSTVKTESFNKQGGYYFKYYYTNESRSASLYFKKDLKEGYHKLIDPLDISAKDVIDFSYYKVSPDGKYVAFSYSRNGSDWREIGVVDIQTETVLKDRIENVKFSGIYWNNDGFYYAKYPYTKFGETVGREIYFHKLGTDASQDRLVISRNKNMDLFTTDDNRFLIIQEFTASGVSNYYYKDHSKNDTVINPLITRVKDEERFSIIGNLDTVFYAYTTNKAPNGMIVRFNKSSARKWEVVVAPFEDSKLSNAWLSQGLVICLYEAEGIEELTIFDLEGKEKKNIQLPLGYSLTNFQTESKDQSAFLTFSGYGAPGIMYKVDLQTFELSPYGSTEVVLDPASIIVERISFKADDGQEIPMTLVRHKNTSINGPQKCLLEAYGGFGVSVSPSFDGGLLHFLNEGGIYAYAHIRGGGERGKSWFEAGKGKNKNRCIQDFINASEFLIQSGRTTSSQLAISGASHGGLVVGAALVLRPELYAAAVPEVGAFDMLRYHRFTVGKFHLEEFGNPDIKDEFDYIVKYSPYHLVKDAKYPAVLIRTGENDDRVPPFHSYKFTAALQNAQKGTSPILLHVASDAGHLGGASAYDTNMERADKYGFILYYLDEQSKK